MLSSAKNKFLFKITDKARADAEIEKLMRMKYSMHSHAWTQRTFFSFPDGLLNTTSWMYFYKTSSGNDYETVAALRKTH
jgi:hypothetical protein